MGPSRAAGGWSGSRRSADGAGQALPDLGRTRTQVACRLQAVLRPGFPASLGRSPRAAAGGQGAARQAGARLWRLAAVLAVLTCGLLASAAAVPAAFATMLPDEGPPAVGVPATATAQQPDKPGSPARASPCSEVCSGGGYASGNSTTRPPAYSLPMILPGAGAPGPCSEVCSGGGYGSVGPSSRTPGDSSAHDTATIPPAGGRVTDSAGFHWGDAGIGAGAMLAMIVLGLGGALTLTRRDNHRIHDKCSPRFGRLWAAQSAAAQGAAGRSRRSPDDGDRAPGTDVPPGADLMIW